MIKNKQEFASAAGNIKDKDNIASIGEYMEKSIHSVLKNYFEIDKAYQEVKVDSYICDIKNEYGIIEIQTRSFDKLRHKLDVFLENFDVTVVYPIIVNKKIVYLDDTSKGLRMSPSHKTIFSGFSELYKIKTYLTNPHLHFHFVYLETLDVKKGYRLNRYHQLKHLSQDSIPLSLIKEESYDTYTDFYKILDGINEPFTVKSLSKLKKAKKEDVQICITVLKYLGIIKHVDTIKREYVYEKIGE